MFMESLLKEGYFKNIFTEQKDSLKCLVLNQNLKIQQIQDLMLESLTEF